jgi:hypothetical protein
MSSNLDIIGSVIIAGMIIVNFSVFIGEQNESQMAAMQNVTTQTESPDITSTLRRDIKMAGYGCDSLPILQANAAGFVFRADIDSDGIIDTIGYTVVKENSERSPATWAAERDTRSGAAVPADGATFSSGDPTFCTGKVLLCRTVNGQRSPDCEVTLLDCGFRYLSSDSYGTLYPSTSLERIRAVSVVLRLPGAQKAGNEHKYTDHEFTVCTGHL